jgi:prevent-host-death family protein
MTGRTIQASAFKARCLALLDEVAATHEAITVTKHGKPIARLVPLESEASLEGSVTLLSEDETDYFSTGEQWDAER